MFITTVRKKADLLEEKARSIANELGIEYIQREKYSLEKLLLKYRDNSAIVVHHDKIIIEDMEDKLYFHPNMAQVRVKRLRSGGKDNMIEAMDLKPGMTVLDCTLGFGADAIVSSFIVGSEGKVVGLESNPYIAYIVRDGLKSYPATNIHLELAMRNIKVINRDYRDILATLPENSFDIVYFDPMFQHPLMNSKNISPLRNYANKLPLSTEALEHAKRVAKKKVVFKENARSNQFSILGFDKVIGGKYSPISYGVIDTDHDRK